jgi:hypothetical protein
MLEIEKPEINQPKWRLITLVMAFLILLFTLATIAMAQADSQSSEKQEPRVTTKLPSSGLVVPVYPRFKQPEGAVDITALKDSYIIMDDGSVLSVADWLLGSLNKSEVGAGMSDYQNRLFLGQVARAAVGLDETLVHTSFRDAGPLRPFRPKGLSAPMAATHGILSMVIPGLAPKWSPAVTGKPTLMSIEQVDYGVGGAILFGEQFSRALFETTEDFIYQGQMLNMLKEYQDKAPK